MICLRVNSNITTKEMAKIISCFLNNTVLRLNRILNKALKICKLLIAFWLIDIAKVYFIIGYYPRFKRAIIIFILCKEGKADYLFLKRVIADYIANTAKKTRPITIKPNRGKKEPLNTISTYTTHCYY